MTRLFVDSSVRLNSGELLDIDGGEGFTVECLEGAVWITQSNDPRDIVLKAGQSFVLDKPGLALVCAADGPATVVVRPEKIAFGAPATDRLIGTVCLRVFQGNHWLYQIETAAGSVLVIRQNAGEPGPAEGETVGLAWRAEDMVVRPGGKEPA